MDKIQFFREICRIKNEPLLTELGDVAVEKKLRPKEYITEPGKQPDEFWILVEGVVCFCGEDAGQKELVDMVISQPGLVSNSILFGYTSTFGEKTLTNTTILSIPLGKVFEMRSKYPELTMLQIRQIQLYAVKYWKLRLVCANMPVHDQVHWFQKADPYAFSVMTGSQLASFLGTTRESVSRVKMRSDQKTNLYDIPGKNCSTKEFQQFYDRLSRFKY